jgi:hypothetical protein
MVELISDFIAVLVSLVITYGIVHVLIFLCFGEADD